MTVWNEAFVDESELLTTTIGHDSSSELEEETQAGPAIQLTHNQTRLDRLQGLQGDIADLCSGLK